MKQTKLTELLELIDLFNRYGWDIFKSQTSGIVKPAEPKISEEIERAYQSGLIGIREYWLLTGNYKPLKELPSVEDDLPPHMKLGLRVQRAITIAKPSQIYTINNPQVKLDLKIQKLIASRKLRDKRMIYTVYRECS